MAYRAPGVVIHQVLTETGSTAVPVQNVVLVGGHASLVRYNGNNKKKSFLNTYGSNVVTLAWPEFETQGNVDEAFTKVFLENALLRYYASTAGITNTHVDANSLNALTTTLKLKATPGTVDKLNPNGDRDSVFADRDVRIGDVVRIIDPLDREGFDFTSRIVDLPAKIASGYVDPTVDTNGNGNKTGSTAGNVEVSDNAFENTNHEFTVTGDASGFTAPNVGTFRESYTLTRTAEPATVGTIGKFELKSESGLDDAIVELSAFNTAEVVGSHNLSISINDSSAATSVPPGLSWRLIVDQPFTEPTIVGAGTYKGEEPVTYIIEVRRGGTPAPVGSPAEPPILFVRTTDGFDTVDNVPVIQGALIPIGTKGVGIRITAGDLAQGDIFGVSAFPPAVSEFKQIVLADNIPMQDTDRPVEIQFFIPQNFELPRRSEVTTGYDNWTTDQSGITFIASIQAYDATWTRNGVQEPLTITSADVYATCRAWNSLLTHDVYRVDSLAGLDDYITGELTPDNPLKYGVYKALSNAGGQPVWFTAVTDPDNVDTWRDATVRLEKNRDLFNIVPLTFNSEVQRVVETHVLSMSQDKKARWRMGWFCSPIPNELGLITSLENPVEATFTESTSGHSGTPSYNYVLATDSDAQFKTLNIRSGDRLRSFFYTDSKGVEQYEEFIIHSVINEATLVLNSGPKHAVNIPQRIEVWRPVTSINYVETVTKSNVFRHRRFVTTWPDKVFADGLTVDGYFLTAAVASLACSLLPQESLTHKSVSGFTGIPNLAQIQDSHLDDITVAGFMPIILDEYGAMIIRHAVTTGDNSLITHREEMFTRNLDSISQYMLARMSGLIGNVNSAPSGLENIKDRMTRGLNELKLRNFREGLGGQIIDFDLYAFGLDEVLKDAVSAQVKVDMPMNINNIDLYLNV